MSLFSRLRQMLRGKPRKKTATIAERQAGVVAYGVERYIHYCAVFAEHYCAGNQIPGLRPMPRAQLVEFFRGTNPMYWLEIVRRDPEEAFGQLQQWQRAEG